MTVKYVDPFGPAWKFQYLRLSFTWRGGIFQSFWLEWCIAVAIGAVAMAIAYVTTKDMSRDDWPETLETLAEVVAFIGRRFQAAIGMMLGFYTSTMYGRWTQVRNSEQLATRQINNIALRIAYKIQEPPAEDDADDGTENHHSYRDEDEKKKISSSSPTTVIRGGGTGSDNASQSTRNIRIKLIRLLNLSHALLVGHLYEGEDNEFCTVDKLRDIGLATKKECNFLNRHQSSDYDFNAPLVWFQNTVRNMVKSGKWYGIEPGTLDFVFAGHIIDYRNAVVDLLMLKNEPIPLIYRQLVNVSTRLYLFMLLLDGIFFEMRKDSEDDGAAGGGSGGLSIGSFWELLKYAFEYFLFVGWLTAADAMGNPFRAWADELEWIDFVKRISKSSLMIALDYGDSSKEVGGPDQDEQNANFVATCDMWHPQQFHYDSTGGESSGDEGGEKGGLLNKVVSRETLTGF